MELFWCSGDVNGAVFCGGYHSSYNAQISCKKGLSLTVIVNMRPDFSNHNNVMLYALSNQVFFFFFAFFSGSGYHWEHSHVAGP